MMPTANSPMIGGMPKREQREATTFAAGSRMAISRASWRVAGISSRCRELRRRRLAERRKGRSEPRAAHALRPAGDRRLTPEQLAVRGKMSACQENHEQENQDGNECDGQVKRQ